MVTRKRIAALIFAWLIATFLASIIWWRLWMYHGWVGSPRWLHQVWPGSIDGDASYDVTFYEMWIISAVAFFVASAVHLTIRSSIGRHKTAPLS